jgi:hypothetical protein
VNGLTPAERAAVYELAVAEHERTGRCLEAIMARLSAEHPEARRQAEASATRMIETQTRQAHETLTAAILRMVQNTEEGAT